LIVVLVIAYISFSVLLYVKQRELLYFPTPPMEVTGATKVNLKSEVGVLKGWVVNPGMPKALIYFGGNGEQVERNADFFIKCLPHHSVYLFPYRGYGGNPGSPSQDGLFSDALLLEEFIKSRHSAVSIMGRSLGTGVAVYVASKRPIEKLLLVTPYDSIAAVATEKYPIFPVRWLLKDPFDSVAYANNVNAAVKILIATEDTIIPPGHSRALAKSFKQRPSVKYIEDADHNTISSAEKYELESCGFLNQD
jgi:pimeloyl-ACP methyl ester carboxylesterase